MRTSTFLLVQSRFHPNLLRNLGRRALDRFTNSDIGSAPAKISAHRFFNVSVRRFWRSFQQRDGAHNLAALTVAALDDVFFHPGVLHRATYWILLHTFNRGYLPITNQ